MPRAPLFALTLVRQRRDIALGVEVTLPKEQLAARKSMQLNFWSSSAAFGRIVTMRWEQLSCFWSIGDDMF